MALDITVVPGSDEERQLIQSYLDEVHYFPEPDELPEDPDDDEDEDIEPDDDEALLGQDELKWLEAIYELKVAGGPMDTTPFSDSQTSNWVARAGGLPPYIRAIAHALVRSGHPESEAIHLAVGVVERWKDGEGNVTAATRAKAAAAYADWERLRGEANTKTLAPGTHITWRYRSGIGHGVIKAVIKEGTDEDTTEYSITQFDHHPGEPAVVHHFGSDITVASKSFDPSEARDKDGKWSKLEAALTESLRDNRKPKPKLPMDSSYDIDAIRAERDKYNVSMTPSGNREVPNRAAADERRMAARAAAANRFTGQIPEGARVVTEWGPGVAEQSSPRRVFIRLDGGETLNVATGTPGYERITREPTVGDVRPSIKKKALELAEGYEEKVVLKRTNPKTCKHPGCEDTPTHGLLWAEGMAQIPVCDAHDSWGRDIIVNKNKDEVVGVRKYKN